MGTILPARPTAAPSPCLVSSLYRLSVGQYERIRVDGTIPGDERVELIDGLLVSRRGKSRAAIVAGNKGLRVLWRVIPAGWHVVKGGPMVVSTWSKPEPDLAVVRGEVEDYDECAVTSVDVALVVEIAETGLTADRTDLARLYAAGGIPVYWIVNLVEGQIEVLSEPCPDGYQSRQVLGVGQDAPVVVAGVEVGWVAVTDLLP
jgi:Uma2 family endonuclease